MDFLSDYFYILILVVGAIAQWLKSRAEAAELKKQEREEPGYHPEALEDFEQEAERRNPRPAVPPPLPAGGGSLPGVGRSAVPDLRRKSPPPPFPVAQVDSSQELARQQALMDQAQQFKLAKRARTKMEIKPPRKAAASSSPAGGMRSRLHNRRKLRSAFVMKEILEKPIGLR